LTVQTRFRSRLFSAVFGVTNVAEFDSVNIAIRNDKIVEF
jgi:hypothetical protein